MPERNLGTSRGVAELPQPFSDTNLFHVRKHVHDCHRRTCVIAQLIPKPKFRRVIFLDFGTVQFLLRQDIVIFQQKTKW